jgi:NAD+ kinase
MTRPGFSAHPDDRGGYNERHPRGRNAMSIKTVGLVINHTKWEALKFGPEVIAWITERDSDVLLNAEAAALLGRDDLAADDATLAGTDLLITLGGDGTILAASHFAAPRGTPILGVHMGRFGFITEARPHELLPALDDILEGRFKVEERMMVRGEVLRDGEVVFSAAGLNDAVISRGAAARMLELSTSFGDEPMAAYPADGVIVATPTGSTAYALSAGGPLVEHTVRALVVVPICPHTLSARPVMIPADETVSVGVDADGGEALFIVDSCHVFVLASGDRVRIRRAEFATKIVTLGTTSFYRKIRERLLWGERLNV